IPVCSTSSDKDSAQSEGRIRVHPMPDWYGHFGQPCRCKIEDRVREHFSVRAERTELRNGTGIEHPIELDRPCPAIRPLPRRILTEEGRLGEHILLTQV